MEMTHRRLEAIMASYGAAAERWPAAERAAILALLARSDAARRHWVDAAALDSVMQPEAPPPPSEALVDRLKAIPAADAPARQRPWRLKSVLSLTAPRRLTVASAFATIAVAFLTGLALPTPFGGTVADPATLATAAPVDAEVTATVAEADIAIVDALSGQDDSDAAVLETGDDGDVTLAVLDLPLE